LSGWKKKESLENEKKEAEIEESLTMKIANLNVTIHVEPS